MATDIDATTLVAERADKAREASHVMANLPREAKDAALRDIASAIDAARAEILEANQADMKAGEDNGTSKAMLDRTKLDDARIDGLMAALEELANQADPVGEVTDGRQLPNGMRLRQVRVPLGVVGVIYEARPNVTVDIAGIAIRSGNAVLLRGGSAAAHTNRVLVRVIQEVLEKRGLPVAAVQSVDDGGRPAANAMMEAVGKIDILIPRGGRNLIQSVVNNAKVPVIQTGEGNVHIFLDASAPAEQSTEIVLNAKTQRPSVCNAVETLLIHADALEGTGKIVLSALVAAGGTLHGDERVAEAVDAEVVPAQEEDFTDEYLDLDIAVKIVDSLDEALAHIERYSTGHTDAIITESVTSQQAFLKNVNSAVVVVNASTRFTDGGEFGLGAEVGISTQKMHARGPMGAVALTSWKWILEGDYNVRS